jgi:C_GCAxxG_C_C family probable redox protein
VRQDVFIFAKKRNIMLKEEMRWSSYAEKAADLFVEGYNCGQAVLMAYAEREGLSPETAARLATAFGGGVGRQRQVCGAVLSLAAVVGLETGSGDVGDKESSNRAAQVTQQLCSEFKEQYGSIVCGEILGLKGFVAAEGPAHQVPLPEKYKGRPCAMKCKWAAELLNRFLEGRGERGERGEKGERKK